MQPFIKTHRYLIDHLDTPVRRDLIGEINWDDRLIGIKGARGIGKTNFLLDYAKRAYGSDKACLYVNLNNLYFSDRTIISFADEFRKTGGQTLILDQVYKYDNWSTELRYIYDNFTDLHIVFSGSSVMRLQEENPELFGKVKSYSLEGFSFREYLNLKAGTSFSSFSLQDILTKHEEICREIVDQVKPLAYFNDYLHHGYYPFLLEDHNYLENLLKNINLTLEIDISYLKQIELKYLPKLRKLLYLVGLSAPFQPNVSKLSNDVETSRATIMNYLIYLKQARLIHLLYDSEEEIVKKPQAVFMQNPNLVFAVSQNDVDMAGVHKTFFYNQLGYQHKLLASKNCDFLVDGNYLFYVNKKIKNLGHNEYCACDMIEIGEKHEIPLWLFGFLF